MTRPRAAAVLTAAACSLATAAAVAVAATPAGAATAHGNSVTVHSGTHHLVHAPSTIHPGIVKLHNSGDRTLFVLGSHGHSAGRLAEDLNAQRKSNGPGRLGEDFVIRDALSPHQTVYLRTKRGTLFLADAERAHYTSSSVRSVRVSGHTRNATLPQSRRMLLTHANALHVASHVPYHGVLHVVNDSTTLQEVLLVRISSTAKPAEVAAFMAHPTFDRLDTLPFSRVEEAGALAAHHALWAPVVGAPGRWAAVSLAVPAHLKHEPAMRVGAFSLF